MFINNLRPCTFEKITAIFYLPLQFLVVERTRNKSQLSLENKILQLAGSWEL